jgi:hypothetical protein
MQAKIDDPYYQYRDRRMFKMGEDERAYYDRWDRMREGGREGRREGAKEGK